jgi:hypothetical protein
VDPFLAHAPWNALEGQAAERESPLESKYAEADIFYVAHAFGHAGTLLGGIPFRYLLKQ